jgi:tRNA pseudouridine38-40 synthase
MQQVWASLLGTHDFTHFGSTGSDPTNPVCTVTQASIQEDGNTLTLNITANHFLYHMVRRLVGTAVRVGRGVLTVDGFRDTWLGLTAKPSGPTAPPHGLTFVAAGYPPHFAWQGPSL